MSPSRSNPRERAAASVLAGLRQLKLQQRERRAFAAEEVAEVTAMHVHEAEAVLDELAETEQIETLTAYWPDQGGSELPTGGRLYKLPDQGQPPT